MDELLLSTDYWKQQYPSESKQLTIDSYAYIPEDQGTSIDSTLEDVLIKLINDKYQTKTLIFTCGDLFHT